MRPRLVMATVDSAGRVTERPPVREGKVFPRNVADRVVEMLTHVVEDDDGTGTLARVPGCAVAGKTGTAEIPQGGHYVPGQDVVSFVGILPADAPQYVIAVIIDRPRTGHNFGGTIAAPVFRDIAESLVTELRLPVATPEGGLEPPVEGAVHP